MPAACAGPAPPQAQGSIREAAAPPAAVIDTNIWLDLYVFHDAAAQPLARRLADGRIRALRSAATDAELRVVLARPEFAARRQALAADPLPAWEALATTVLPQRAAPWICRDPDDQKFLELAWSAGAALLFTKDRALLSLARRARRDGLVILAPAKLASTPDAAPALGYR